MAVGITGAGLAGHIQEPLVFAAADSPVDFDFSLFIMIALFLGLMVYFNAVLYRPYLKSREMRDDRIDGAKHQARDMQKRADGIFAEYEDKLSQALREASAQRQEVREEAKTEEARIVQAARAEMDQMLKAARVDLEAEVDKARVDLERLANELSAVIVERVLA